MQEFLIYKQLLLHFISLFYASDVRVCESKILFFIPAVIKCCYLLQQIFCDTKMRFVGRLLLNLSLGCTINLTEY
jgi:hypothetical protein